MSIIAHYLLHDTYVTNVNNGVDLILKEFNVNILQSIRWKKGFILFHSFENPLFHKKEIILFYQK